MRARQKVSRAGVELIKSFEGLRQTAARLPDGRWTLGYGHTFSARDGATVTQEDADALLRFDLLPIVDAINNLVLANLNQNQFDALVSFSFNIGVDNFATSGVLKRINEGRMTEAAQAMDSWRSAEFNGQTYVLAPLIRRRAAEKNLFLTPEDATVNAPSLLIRPVEDALGETSGRPSEVDAPDRNGMLSARPLNEPEVVPTPLPYASSFEISATPQPVPAAPVPAAQERQVIDLAAFAPRTAESPTPAPTPVQAQPAPVAPILAQPYAAPVEAVVEHLPHGLMPTGSVRETPPEPVVAPAVSVVEQSPTSYDYDPAPVMSPDVQAALARAHEEQRLRDEAQRQAEAMAASRAAEDARLHEEVRLREEARLQELQRQDSLRAEQARLEAARQDAIRQEQDRLAREEQMRNELIRVEQARIEQARLDQVRLEQARMEQDAAERQRQEAVRLEMERQEQARLEQMRLEQARIDQAQAEQARAEQARVEQERLEQARLEQARLEQARLEQERQVQPAAAPVILDEDAEKARKAEAAAALMRLYSPYGSGNLGRPLTPSVLAPNRPATAPEPRVEVQPDPQPEPARVVPAPETTPSPVAAAPITRIISTEEPEDDELPKTVSFAFKPGQSASSMPAPQITALNPYARPVPEAAEKVVEVPRPAPVDLSVPMASQPVTTPATESLHWREQLQRPLPQDYKTPDPATQTAQPEQASLLRGARFGDTFEDGDDWTDASGRIALSSEEMEEEAVSWWKMIVSTLWWILISAMGLACLGFASAAYYKAIKDPSVLRNGFQQDYTTLSVIAAAVGIFFVCVSVWLIMKRLGGLKD